MSCILYIASNNPLPLQENPHEKPLSVREALALGITDLPDYLLAEDFDKDKPDVPCRPKKLTAPKSNGISQQNGQKD